jgi:hypothetical protein
VTNQPLTPAEHRKVRANAWLMYCRQAAEWGGPVAVPSCRLESEVPKPPDPKAIHPHKRSWHYRPKARKPKGGNA